MLLALVPFCFSNIRLHHDPNSTGRTMYSASDQVQGGKIFLLNYLQYCKIMLTFQTETFTKVWFHVVLVTTGLGPPTEVIVLKGKARERETEQPSDKRWLPSTSAGICHFYHLIMLQSSTGTLRVVNYFAKQCGDVPRRTMQPSAEQNKDADIKLKSVRAGMKRRLSSRER